MLPNPQPYFANLPDRRRETKNKLHELEDIVMGVSPSWGRAPYLGRNYRIVG